MFFKQNPFVRLLIPLLIGIVLQWHLQLPFYFSIAVFVLFFLSAISFQWLRGYKRFKYQPMQGLFIYAGLLGLGMMLTWFNDVRHDTNGLFQNYKQDQILVATLQEPLSEKEKTYKAEADVTHLIQGDSSISVIGKVLVYFKKDNNNAKLKAGDKILFRKTLQEINNTGNPAAFDYKRYCLFNGITYQVFLSKDDYVILSEEHLSRLKKWLIDSRTFVLNAIRKNINGKKEQGLAEAMLIGYRDDLDKTLLQSYTNTGVVHVIAVSGMHLALLYWILNLLFRPLLIKKTTRWLHPVLVLLLLWSFAFITGGAASIVRAAVMFSLITIGKELDRNASIYNILAGAAFLQLCYNPYWLWDVGFQLSYVAVLSIVIFYKPILNLFSIENKIVYWIWQLASVSIAAQILTTPFSIYYFHQFPVYFLVTNLVVVPASTFILVATLALVVLSPIQILASLIGVLLNECIKLLNNFISFMEQMPMAVWGGLQISILQSFLLLLLITGIAALLMEKYKPGLWMALASLLMFFAIRAYSFYEAGSQHRMIVYNIPKRNVMDFIEGRNYHSLSDTLLQTNLAINNYVLNPSRIAQRVQVFAPVHLIQYGNVILFGNKRILLVDAPISDSEIKEKLDAEVVVISGNPRLYMNHLLSHVHPKQIVVTASVPAWRAKFWEKDCDSLGIPLHNVAKNGAFVLDQ